MSISSIGAGASRMTMEITHLKPSFLDFIPLISKRVGIDLLIYIS